MTRAEEERLGAEADYYQSVADEQRRGAGRTRYTPDPFLSWLWPDRAITRDESGAMRREHNRTCDIATDLLAACEAALKAHRVNRKQIAGTDALEDQLRAALAAAKGGAQAP